MIELLKHFLKTYGYESILLISNGFTWFITWLTTQKSDQNRIIKFLPQETTDQINKRDKRIKILEAEKKILLEEIAEIKAILKTVKGAFRMFQ